jgi:hypothetical protein
MSREIDLSKPLNDEDRKYLADRGRHAEIKFADSKQGQDLSEEEWLELQRKAEVEAMGRRVPIQMDPTVTREQNEDQFEDDGTDDTDGESRELGPDEYDPDDVQFVNSCEYPELQAHLKNRELSAQGDKSTLQKRLLDALKAETQAAAANEGNSGN